MSEVFQKLLLLNVRQKVQRELENHAGIGEATLANFIIHLAQESESGEELSKKIEEQAPVGWDIAFVRNLYQLITRMLAAPKILSDASDATDAHESNGDTSADTSAKKDQPEMDTYSKKDSDELRKKKEQFPGLSQPNAIIDHSSSVTAPSTLSSRSDTTISAGSDAFIHPSRRHRVINEERRSPHRSHPSYNSNDTRERIRNEDESAHDYRGRRRDRFGREDRRGHRCHSRSRSRDRGRHRRSPEFHGGPSELVKYGIYNGTVESVKDFGAFVALRGVRWPDGSKISGLVGRGFITKDSTVPKVSNYLTRGDEVKVKVVTIHGRKVGLSLRSVDQETGEDLAPRRNHGNRDTREHRSQEGSHSGLFDHPDGMDIRNTKRRRMKPSSLDRWEMSQLRKNVSSATLRSIKNRSSKANGDVSEMDEEDEEDADEVEEELDIELNEAEPHFLRGQTSMSAFPMAAEDEGKVARNMDGSMMTAARLSTALAKERREIREAKYRDESDAVPLDLTKRYEDRTLTEESETPLFAQMLRNMGQSAIQAPEWREATFGRNQATGMVRTTPMKEQRESLPIFGFKTELMKAVRENDILVVIGQTGSGKTTQIPQYLAEDGYIREGVIGVTQPRRVAAMSVATRVAEEYGCGLGKEVGYSIRFEDCTSPSTVVKYMTAGMLLRECLHDLNLTRYSVIMLDEAHERAVDTDVLFVLLKRAAKKRNSESGPGRRPLKLIVTSATLDAEKFSAYFDYCPVFTIPGRLFPVSILYARQPEEDYLESALNTCLNIHLTEPKGDILVFLTGKEEIDTACEILYSRVARLKGAPPLLVLPVYSALPSEMQTRIFEPAPDGTRKCIIATNIAEASLTIDGIYYVVDPGFVKQQVFDPKLRMNKLEIVPICQNSANQRAGRAGRTGPGKCFRLYTQNAFKTEMLKSSVPEIKRVNLGNVVLTLKAMGIHDLIGFDFLDAPNTATLVASMQNLYNLGALDEEGLLTRLGRRMAEFPLDPQLSKMLITAVDLRCAEEILTIVAMLQCDNVWHRPRDKQAVADQKRATFFVKEGDQLTLLRVFEKWREAKFSGAWCKQYYLQSRALRHALEVRKQLVAIMDRYGLEITSCGRDYTRVRKAITAGYFMHACRKDPTEGYKSMVEGQQAYIHPSSSLFNRQPDWLIYHNLVLTSKEYMRECIAIDPRWLVQLAPTFFRVADAAKMSRRKRYEKIEPLYDKYAEPGAWRLSRRRY